MEAADVETEELDPLAETEECTIKLESPPSPTDSDSAQRRVSSPCPSTTNPSVLFPITKQMRERIKRMKQRMLATLKLSDEELSERRQKRAAQTRESRQRLATDAGYHSKETARRIARNKIQREMETLEQIQARRAKKRAERAKHLATETPEQRARRREYQRVYNQTRRPIKFN